MPRNLRLELQLPNDDPLDPSRLAAHLAIPVVPLSEVIGLNPRHLRYFRDKGQSEFSATTVVDDDGFKMIAHNDAHKPYRQNSNIMHEIAHIVLGHPPRPPLMEDNCRHFDPVCEGEASELGFTLLVPKRAALRIVETRMEIDTACAAYGVRPSLLEYRIRITNAAGWAANRRRFRPAAE